jgi:hypothetical protein
MIGNPTIIAGTPPFGRSALFGVYRCARSCRTDDDHSRCDCHAEPKAVWPSSPSRNSLLLGPCTRFRHDVCPRVLQMERGPPPVLWGLLSFVAATIGPRARRRLWRCWPRIHIAGMPASYILMITAFYVDNGPNLPLWRELPPLAFWILPALIGAPIPPMRCSSSADESLPEPLAAVQEREERERQSMRGLIERGRRRRR